MKVFILSLILSFTASASFYVVNCSSADGSFTSSSGHTQNQTSYRVVDGRLNTEKRISITNFDQKVLSTSVVKDKSTKFCTDSGAGSISWQKLEVLSKLITLKGAELFDSSLNGVSADRKSLTVTVLCETKGNSRTSCN